MVRSIIYILFLLPFLSSCYTYKIYPKEDRHFVFSGARKRAIVLNPDLKKEYSILKASGIFDLSTDTVSSDVVKIRLKPMFRGFLCGNAIMVSAFTLGQVPVYFPDTYQYSFTEIKGMESIERVIPLGVWQRYWFWDLFAIPKGFHKKAGQALLARYYQP